MACYGDSPCMGPLGSAVSQNARRLCSLTHTASVAATRVAVSPDPTLLLLSHGETGSSYRYVPGLLWRHVLIENLIVAQLVNKFLTFYAFRNP
jgi:hypothetical protein